MKENLCASVSVTIALVANTKAKCDVSVSRDIYGEQTWQRFGWSIGGLTLSSNSGIWKYHHPEKTLYLLDSELGAVAYATNLRSDFLTFVVCGKSLESDGDVWGQGAYRAAKWNFWYGCA